MLVYSASQLLTLTGGPQRGDELGRLSILPEGAVLIRGEKIAAVGTTEELRARYPNEPAFDASGCVVLPGLVDAHTHLVWAGDRADEFEARLRGRTYLEALEGGGGILSTVRRTRLATDGELLEGSRKRAAVMFRHGTTTAEAKTGYGLSTAEELRLANLVLALDRQLPLDLVPTFLPAHAIPPEFQGKAEAYVTLVVEEMLPAAANLFAPLISAGEAPFVDIFCDEGAFDLAQTERILRAAKALGFRLKVHADEFAPLGAVPLAVSLGATSVDHLTVTPPDEIRLLGQSDTAAVFLPATPFGLGEAHYPAAQDFLAANALIALGSDLNPGTAWCGNMQMVLAIACRALGLTPAQAIAAATINAAAALGKDQRVGSIEPGKQADMIVLSASDYRHLGYRFGGNLVRAVIKRGLLYTLTPDESWPAAQSV